MHDPAITLFFIFIGCAVVCIGIQRALGLTETEDNQSNQGAQE